MNSVEELVGRDFLSSGRKSVQSFNLLPQELLSEVRDLASKSRVAAAVYLRHYVELVDGYDDFIEDVLIAGESAQEWGIQDVIVFPTPRLRSLLTTEFRVLLDSLSKHGDTLSRVSPTLETWWEYPGVGGAPGIVVSQAPYWFEAGEGLSFAAVDISVIETIDDAQAEMALGDWVASRVARDCQQHEQSEVDTPEGIAGKLGIRVETMSADARRTIEALLASEWPERRPLPDALRPGHMLDGEKLPPGFTREIKSRVEHSNG